MNYLPPNIVSRIIFHLPLPFPPLPGIIFIYRYLFVGALELFYIWGISQKLWRFLLMYGVGRLLRSFAEGISVLFSEDHKIMQMT